MMFWLGLPVTIALLCIIYGVGVLIDTTADSRGNDVPSTFGVGLLGTFVLFILFMLTLAFGNLVGYYLFGWGAQ